jgi:FRG domain
MESVEFGQWSEFRSWIDKDRPGQPVYWRGQKDPSWPLASSFERMILNMFAKPCIYPYGGYLDNPGKTMPVSGFYQKRRDRYLNAFKTATDGLRGSNPAQLDTDQWWALGRHFGLVTPLLDWTRSPYIAAFFPLWAVFSDALRPVGSLIFKGSKIAVYRLLHDERLVGDGLRVVQPAVQELGRMHGQRGLFTWLDSDKYFELQGFLDNMSRGDLLTQLIISDAAVQDGLRDLKAHGIDYRSIYPDLIGAAMHANSQWDVF